MKSIIKEQPNIDDGIEKALLKKVDIPDRILNVPISEEDIKFKPVNLNHNIDSLLSKNKINPYSIKGLDFGDLTELTKQTDNIGYRKKNDNGDLNFLIPQENKSYSYYSSNNTKSKDIFDIFDGVITKPDKQAKFDPWANIGNPKSTNEAIKILNLSEMEKSKAAFLLKLKSSSLNSFLFIGI